MGGGGACGHHTVQLEILFLLFSHYEYKYRCKYRSQGFFGWILYSSTTVVQYSGLWNKGRPDIYNEIC